MADKQQQQQLVSFDVDEVQIPFALGKRVTYKVRIKSLVATTAVAYKVQTTSPKKFGVKPHTGILKPLATTTFVIILQPQHAVSEDFPIPRHHHAHPGGAVAATTPPLAQPVVRHQALQADVQVVVALKIRVVYIGGEILRLSAAKGSKESIQDVLLRGTNVNAKDEQGRTALSIAALRGDPDIVQELLEAGAAVDGPRGAGLTPLQEAAFTVHSTIVTMLLRAKANKEIPSHPRGWTALHLAASRGRVGVLRILLKAGANEKVPDKDMRTPLHEAITEGHTKAALLLLQNGADADPQSRDGRTPLHCAAMVGHLATMELLVDWRASKDIKDVDRKTPFELAMVNEHTFVLDSLVFAQSGARGKCASAPALLAARRAGGRIRPSRVHRAPPRGDQEACCRAGGAAGRPRRGRECPRPRGVLRPALRCHLWPRRRVRRPPPARRRGERALCQRLHAAACVRGDGLRGGGLLGTRL